MATGIKVPIEGDVTPLLAEFAKLPGRTQAEMEAIGRITEQEITRGRINKAFAQLPGIAGTNAKKASAMVSKEMDRAAKSAEHAAKIEADAFGRAATEVARSAKRMADDVARANENIKRGSERVFGGWIGDLEDVGVAIASMSAPMAAMAVGLGGLGIAAGTVVSVATAVWGLVSAGQAAVIELDKLHIPIDDTDRANLESASLAIKGLQAATNQASVVIGGALAPAMTMAMTTSTGIVESLITIKDNAGWTGLAIAALRVGVETYGEAMAAPITANNLFGGSIDLIAASSFSATTSMDAMSVAIRAKNEAMRDVGELVTLSSDERAEQAAERAALLQKKIAQSVVKRAAANRDAADAADAEMKAADLAAKQSEDRWKAKVDAAQEVVDANRDAADAEMKAADLAAKQSEDRWKAKVDAAQEVVNANKKAALETEASWSLTYSTIGGLVQSGTQAIIEGAKDGSDAQKQAAIVAFRIQQAAQIAMIAAQTPALVASLTLALAPSLGLAAIPIGLAAGLAQGAIAVAGIASASPPFHSGGIVGQGSLAPDEQMVRARRGEEIRTRQQQQDAPMVISVQQVYQHRSFNTFVADNIGQLNSPIRKEIASSSTRRVGHRGAR